MTAGVVRPMGVTVMAVVAVIAGILDILAGLGDIGIGGGFLTKIGFGTTLDGIMMIVGLFVVAVGVLGLVSGFGLWLERDWAWLIARLWASLCIIVGLVSAGLSLSRHHPHERDHRRDRCGARTRHRRRRGALVPVPAAGQGGVPANVVQMPDVSNAEEM